MAQKSKSDPATYTEPELRDKIKEEIVSGDKGGNPGQWSARKAQLVTQEYQQEGGGYKKPRSQAQKSLKKWGDEKWTTADGKPAKRAGGTTRYLPQEAWDQLSPEQKRQTNKKKVEGSREGKQFVSNTPVAASARKKATGTKPPAKKAVAKKTATKKPATRKASPGKR